MDGQLLATTILLIVSIVDYSAHSRQISLTHFICEYASLDDKYGD
jgi:hypothetical protein